MEGKKIQAVMLDLGDTVLGYGKLDLPRVYEQACRRSYRYLKQLGQKVGSFKAYMLRNLISIRWRAFVSELTGNDFDSLSVMKKIGKKHKFDLTDDQWEHLSWLWYGPLGDMAVVEDDIIDTFKKFKEMGLKVCLLSNTFVHSSTLIKHLKEICLWEYFDAAVFSYELKFRKPNKKIFLHACDLIDISPENVIFVGDRIKADVKGSSSCGMTPVLKKAYTNDGKRVPDGVAVIEKLSELPAIIENINSKN